MYVISGTTHCAIYWKLVTQYRGRSQGNPFISLIGFLGRGGGQEKN